MKRILALLLLCSVANADTGGTSLKGTGYRLIPQLAAPDAFTLGRVGVWYSSATDALYFRKADGTDQDLLADGGGSVTSVALTAPSFLSVAGSPITSSGTLAVTLATQSASRVLVGPTSGSAASPTFRQLTMDDIGAAFAASLSAGFTTTVEIGATITNPTFTASYNQSVASATITDATDTQSINSPFTTIAYNSGASGPPARTYSSNTVNATKTWTLSATSSGGIVDTSDVSAAWRPLVFYSTATPASITESFIEALTSSALASAYARTIAYGAGAGTKKLVYAFPSSYGTPVSFTDTATGFAVPFSLVGSSVSVTNTNGVTITYNVWQSDNYLDNAVTVQVQ